ncbi:MAG: beta-ketoacyl-[acyl-carrier-protein] synthase family protein [Deltaproteobacteria bacterium]|nr:MAG: beta-ketoacyl-[acyl-carrier-protein] synthase family protein [Deltaproteobacteria bacterium]
MKNEPRPSVWITDAVTVTALGNTLWESWQGIVAGQTAIRPVRRFSVDSCNARVAACIEGLEPSGEHSMIHALTERLLTSIGPVPSDALLITATTKSGIDNLERLHQGVSADDQDILLTSIADTVSQKLGLTGKGINISAACASSAIAVARGAGQIASGMAEAVLICCLDIVTEFVFSGFSCLRAMSPEPCRPFDRDRDGLSLGEGAAALLLMSKERACREGRECLGTVMGWGAANDATHLTAPARDGCGLIQAISQAVKKAGLKAEDIATISAHGTGTIYNDMMELTAFREVFGNRKIPVYSIKGAIGHTLGAAGGIEVAVGLKTLSEQIAPPSVGLAHPEGWASGRVSPEPADISGEFLLTTNSGFGGINAAIILGRAI